MNLHITLSQHVFTMTQFKSNHHWGSQVGGVKAQRTTLYQDGCFKQELERAILTIVTPEFLFWDLIYPMGCKRHHNCAQWDKSEMLQSIRVEKATLDLFNFNFERWHHFNICTAFTEFIHSRLFATMKILRE